MHLGVDRRQSAPALRGGQVAAGDRVDVHKL